MYWSDLGLCLPLSSAPKNETARRTLEGLPDRFLSCCPSAPGGREGSCLLTSLPAWVLVILVGATRHLADDVGHRPGLSGHLPIFGERSTQAPSGFFTGLFPFEFLEFFM